MKKIRVLLLTLVLAVTMMAGSLAVFAETSANNEGKVTVTKTVNGAIGVSDTSTYSFTVTPVTEGAAAATLNPIEVTKGAAVATASKDGALQFGTWTHAGVFEYTVTETAGSNTDIKYDKSEYTVRVYVENVKDPETGEYSLAIADITAFKTKDEKGTAIAEENQKKVTKLDFVNEVTKKTNLTVSKAVTNPAYAEDTEYEFTVEFTSDNDFAAVPKSISATVAGVDTTLTVSGGKVTFKLKDGETAVFNDLDAGLKYTILETKPAATAGAASFTSATFVQKDGDTQLASTTQSASEVGTAIAAQTVTEGNDNTCDVTNLYEKITITGVIMNVLPFVMMIAIAGAAMALYVVSRRRRAAR